MSRIIQGGSKWFRLPSTVDFWQDSLTVQFGMQGAAWFQSSPGSNDLTSIFVGLADKKQRCLTFHWHPGLLGKAHLPLERESLTENLNQNHIMGIKTLSQKWCSKNQNLTSTLEAGWTIFFYHICTPLPWNQLEFCFWNILPANLKHDKRLVFFFSACLGDIKVLQAEMPSLLALVIEAMQKHASAPEVRRLANPGGPTLTR